jgi:hypothetical protein
VPCNLARALKHVVQPIPARRVLFHMRMVHKIKLRTHLRGTLILAKDDDLHIAIQQLPTLQRIPLDNPVMSSESLRGREKCQHAV